MLRVRLIKALPFLIFLILFIVPFFWLPPGTVDYGGDSSRLYFYDPVAFLKNTSLYFIVPQGTGLIEPNFYYLPYVFTLSLLKTIFNSSYLLASFINSLKLSLAFFFMFLIIKNLLMNERIEEKKVYLSATAASMFYILMPTMTGNWDRALTSHNQVFLNPMMFYFIFKLLYTNKYSFGVMAILTSLLFAPNFGLTSAPPFFAFYPLALIFLFFYLMSRRIKINWKTIFLFMFLFLGIHSFHLIPQIISLLEPGSFANTRVFDQESIVNEGVRYFISILPLAKVSSNILLLHSKVFNISAFSIAVFFILGALIKRKAPRAYLLTIIFFLVTLFLLSANITSLGNEFYKSLFYIPGFSMFRNFIGQWLFVFSFFYSLSFAFAVSFILKHLSHRAQLVLVTALIVLFSYSSLNFLEGKQTNKFVFSDPPLRAATEFSNDYKKVISAVKDLPEGKILTLPLSDSFYQVTVGRKGVYVGPSVIGHISGRNDFVGYQVLRPFSEQIMRYVRENNYDGISRILSLLNIRYILFYKSPIYNQPAPDYFSYMRKSLPSTNEGYLRFIDRLGAEKKMTMGNYTIYELSEKYNLNHIYYPERVIVYSKSASKSSEIILPITNEESKKIVFIEQNICNNNEVISRKCTFEKHYSPKLKYKKINPVLYEIEISRVTDDFILVFSEAYHPKWRLYASYKNEKINPVKSYFGIINGKEIAGKTHFQSNGYSNAWVISKDSLEQENKAITKLYLVNKNQTMLVYTFGISFISLAITIYLLLYILQNRVADIINFVKNKI